MSFWPGNQRAVGAQRRFTLSFEGCTPNFPPNPPPIQQSPNPDPQRITPNPANSPPPQPPLPTARPAYKHSPFHPAPTPSAPVSLSPAPQKAIRHAPAKS